MAANIPIVALPILFGVDRIFDMLRTAVNITGDAACATIVDGLRAVSYTHLDVYKRQLLLLPKRGRLQQL